GRRERVSEEEALDGDEQVRDGLGIRVERADERRHAPRAREPAHPALLVAEADPHESRLSHVDARNPRLSLPTASGGVKAAGLVRGSTSAGPRGALTRRRASAPRSGGAPGRARGRARRAPRRPPRPPGT